MPRIKVNHLFSEIIKASNKKYIFFGKNIIGIDINKKDSLGKTALHYASHYKKIDMVESLLLKGADYTITDSHNKTAIDEATTPEIIDIINEYKNQQDTQKEYSDAQNQNNYEFNVNLAGDLQND